MAQQDFLITTTPKGKPRAEIKGEVSPDYATLNTTSFIEIKEVVPFVLLEKNDPDSFTAI